MISNKLPLIRRARDYHLYDEKGRRYLDFYQNNGRAILGHRPGRTAQELKNTLSKGLTAEYPSIYGRRLEKALHSLLPEYPGFRVYANAERAEAALRGAGILDERSGIADPLMGSLSPGPSGLSAGWWRPFLPENTELPPVILPVLPFPGVFSPVPVCYRGDTGIGLRGSDVCSPVLLAVLARAVYDLIKHGENVDKKQWRLFDFLSCERKGPYLLFRYSEKEYSDLFYELLQEGYVLNPRSGGINIVPGEFTEGEIKDMKRRFQ